jgi:aquaporin Z
VGGSWSDYWVYVAGPLTGAIIAVGCAVILRGGGGGDPTARLAASGKLGLIARSRVKEEQDAR